MSDIRKELEERGYRFDRTETAVSKRCLVSTLRIQLCGGHWHLGVWIHGTKSGELVVSSEDLFRVIDRFAGPETVLEYVEV